MRTFTRMETAAELPGTWDTMAEHYFQQRAFLEHAEQYNPCSQRYYLCHEADKLASVAILYTLRLDFLTYLNIKSPLKMHIIGIPCSVSSPGIFGEPEAFVALKQHIMEQEKGFLLFLNLTEKPLEKGTISGTTLPTIVLTNQFSDWKSYQASLRSGYRRRLKQINAADETIRFVKTECSDFSLRMYELYLEVYKRSEGKLEKLSFDFFRNLPKEFILTVCYKNEQMIGWNLALENRNTYYFFLGGIDYKHNRANNTYLRLLSRLVNDGVERHAKFIELGQTAEIAKMRMGGMPEPLYMQVHHHSRFFRTLFKLASPLLVYKRTLENTNAIKQNV